jgi:membrane-bound lytic murein transglycosylase A
MRALFFALVSMLVFVGPVQAGPDCTCEAKNIELAAPPHDQLKLTRVKLGEVPGWSDDHVAEAVPALLASCSRLAQLDDNAPVGTDGHGGLAKQGRHACAAAAKLSAGDDAAAHAFFEAEFVPYAAAGNSGTTGKLTGFYVQELRASRTKHGAFVVPVMARPADLVTVELAQFIYDAHARRVWGRLATNGEIGPYFTRAEIRAGALANKQLELMYADDATDVLFAQIEGSAKAALDDGSEVWLEFAGKNGRAYKGVGGVLKELGESSPTGFTMQGIRKWFAGHASRFDEIADQDASYVFFKQSKQPGGVGSQQVILTPRRSMAVDRSLIALSTPIFVDTRAPVVGKPGVVAPWQHLLIAQDTGAGIQGAVRGDIYWGADHDAEEIGGRMGGSGRYWVLLPKGVTK